jgi:hypothetical protein
MHKFIAPAAVAAALLAAVAVPTAAQAAPRTVPVPEIGAVFSNGEHTSVHDGIAEMSTAPRMGIGSANGTTGFDDARVVVRDAQGREVCDTDDNGYDSDGGWECNATPTTLPVGTHTIRAIAYDADGTPSAASAPVRLTVTGEAGGDDDSTAEPVAGGVDAGFTAPGATAQPAPGDVDAGFTHPGSGAVADPSIPTPQGVVNEFGDLRSIGATVQSGLTVDIHDEGGALVASKRANGGFAESLVPTPAAGTSATYLVTAHDDEQHTSAPLRLTVHGQAVSGEAVVAQPAPGGVDAGFTAPGSGDGDGNGSDDSVAQPAPGDVDAGFTHPGAESGDSFAAPTADWAYIRSIGGQQTVIAALHTRPGATVVVTESNGTVHRFTADGSGRVDVSMPWMGNASPAFTAVAHDGDTVSATATIMPTRG